MSNLYMRYAARPVPSLVMHSLANASADSENQSECPQLDALYKSRRLQRNGAVEK